MPLFLILYFTDCYWDEYDFTSINFAGGGGVVVWTWGGLEACLFWSCIDVIVVRVEVSRGIVPFSLTGIASAYTSEPPNVEICMEKSHLLPNNPTRIQLIVPGFLQLELLLSRGTLYSISFSRCCGSAFGFQLLNESREPNQCRSGSGSWSDLAVTKSWILHEKYTKAFLKGWNSGIFVNFGQFLCSWIRIHIPDMDPDQGESSQRGSMRI